MKKVKGKNDNILSDEYRMYGKTMESAVAEFSRMENCTKIADIDLSCITFLSPIEDTDSSIVRTVHLDGGQQIAWNTESGSLSLDADLVNIKLPSIKPFQVEYPAMVTGGIATTPLAASNEDLYFLSNAVLHQLQKVTNVSSIGKSARNLLRDCAFAYKCAEMMDEHLEAIVYRESDGIKKVVGCYETRPATPNLADVMAAADYVSAKTGRRYEIDKWEITQYFRKVHFIDKTSGENEGKHELEYCWSDCGQKSLTVTSHVRGGKVKPKLKALKEASMTAALAVA